ncbi:hypothetical protein [Draconibacterium orientale]|uniref:hypothetical protein n=1 Tax=Draconibacterium orientale TaxID=1168034 RepID=UPI0029C05B2E|nr:hypothetical protein [Draconibacterium orientale]
MTATTANSMNFLFQKNDARVNGKVPTAMKDMVVKETARLNISESMYIRMAIQEKLERDLVKK